MEDELTGKTLCVRLAPIVLLLAAAVIPTAAQPSKQTATEFYTAYRTAFAKAKAIEDLSPYMSKEMKAQVDSTPAAQRPEMFAFIKEMSASMTNVKVLDETKTNEGVTLTVEAMDGKERMTGQVRILQENGAWKMGRESWSNKS
jgi:hypothetical protein